MIRLLALISILNCNSYIKDVRKGFENKNIVKMVFRNYHDNEFTFFKMNFNNLNKNEQEELLLKASKDNRKEYIEYMLGLDINPFILDENGFGLQQIIIDEKLKTKLKAKQNSIMILSAVKNGNIKGLDALSSEDVYTKKDHECNEIINKILKILNQEKNEEFINLFFTKYLSKCFDNYEEGKKLLRKIIIGNNLDLLKILINFDNIYLNYIDASLLEDVNKKNMHDMFEYLANKIHLDEEDIKRILKDGDVQTAKSLMHKLEGRDILNYAISNDINSLITILSKDLDFKKMIMEELKKDEPDLKCLSKMLDQSNLTKEDIKKLRKEAVNDEKSEELIKILSSRI